MIPEREPERRLPLLRRAAGTQIAQYRNLVRQRREIVFPHFVWDCNGWYLKPPTSNNWRTSLVPAPAVIPAPRAYINAAAVKGFVV